MYQGFLQSAGNRWLLLILLIAAADYCWLQKCSIYPSHRDATNTANQIKVCCASNFLSASRTKIFVRLRSFGACRFSGCSSCKFNSHIKAARRKLWGKSFCRVCYWISGCAVIIDFQVASFRFSLKSFIMVTVVLASILNLVYKAIKMNHFMKDCRSRICHWFIYKFSAKINLIHSRIIGDPYLLGWAMTVCSRCRLNRNDGSRQLILKINTVELVK